MVRVWAFGEGMPEGFMPESYKYNEDMFRKLGYVVAEAKKRNIFVLITLSSYDDAYGGVPKYLQFDGIPNRTMEDKSMTRIIFI